MTLIIFADVQSTLSNGNAQTVLAVCVVALVTALVYIFRLLLLAIKERDRQYEVRLSEAKEYRDKLLVPLDQQTDVSRKTYELLQSIADRRK